MASKRQRHSAKNIRTQMQSDWVMAAAAIAAPIIAKALSKKDKSKGSEEVASTETKPQAPPQRIPSRHDEGTTSTGTGDSSFASAVTTISSSLPKGAKVTITGGTETEKA
jgi:hypothetical protein